MITQMQMMAVINRLRIDFVESLTTADATAMKPFLFMPNALTTENLGWVGQSPQMRKWLDERIPSGLRNYKNAITAEPYEASLAIDTRDMKRMAKLMQVNQASGVVSKDVIQLRVADLAVRARNYPAYMLTDLRTAGTTALAYDGATFYSDSHSEGDSGAQSNKVGQSGTTVEAAKVDFTSAKTKRRQFKDDRGIRQKGVKPEWWITCGSSMEDVLREAFLLNAVATAGPNPFANQIKAIEVDADITGTEWYLEDFSGELRPFILTEEGDGIEVSNTMVNGTDGMTVEQFMRRKVYFGVEWNGGSGYGDWRRSIRIA